MKINSLTTIQRINAAYNYCHNKANQHEKALEYFEKADIALHAPIGVANVCAAGLAVLNTTGVSHPWINILSISMILTSTIFQSILVSFAVPQNIMAHKRSLEGYEYIINFLERELCVNFNSSSDFVPLESDEIPFGGLQTGSTLKVTDEVTYTAYLLDTMSLFLKKVDEDEPELPWGIDIPETTKALIKE